MNSPVSSGFPSQITGNPVPSISEQVLQLSTSRFVPITSPANSTPTSIAADGVNVRSSSSTSRTASESKSSPAAVISSASSNASADVHVQLQRMISDPSRRTRAKSTAAFATSGLFMVACLSAFLLVYKHRRAALASVDMQKRLAASFAPFLKQQSQKTQGL